MILMKRLGLLKIVYSWWKATFTTWETMSGGFAIPLTFFALQNSWSAGRAFAISAIVALWITLIQIVTRHARLENERSVSATPKLRVQLRYSEDTVYHAMGKKIGQTDVTHERIAVLVTNIGPKVSIEDVTLVIQLNDIDKIQRPVPPIPALPQPLDTNNTLPPQNYLGKPGALSELIALNPRIIVKTSCGYTQVFGSDVFKAMKAPHGGDWSTPT